MSHGAPQRRPVAQRDAIGLGRTPDRRRDRSRTAARHAPAALRERTRRHSIPIAPAGARFSPTRFSLTGADSSRGTHAEGPVRRAAKRKTLSIITLYEGQGERQGERRPTEREGEDRERVSRNGNTPTAGPAAIRSAGRLARERRRCCAVQPAAERRGVRGRPGSFSASGGKRAAAICSLPETAKLNPLDPEDHLHQVPAHIADYLVLQPRRGPRTAGSARRGLSLRLPASEQHQPAAEHVGLPRTQRDKTAQPRQIRWIGTSPRRNPIVSRPPRSLSCEAVRH